MYLVDTTVLAEMRKQAKADPGVRAFFENAASDDAAIYLSVLTVGEVRRAVELVRQRGKTAQAVKLEDWMAEVLEEFGNHILAVDHEIAQVWGRLRAVRSAHSTDKLIAATALIHDLTVVTSNVDGFAGTGVRLLNPFAKR